MECHLLTKLSFPLCVFLPPCQRPDDCMYEMCLVAQSCLILCKLHELYLARFLCPWGFSRQKYWSGLACPSPGDLPNPGIESRSPVLQVDSLPSEPPGNPKITVEGSLSLLKVIFLRNQTRVLCIAGGFFTSWAMREALLKPYCVHALAFFLGSQFFSSGLYVYFMPISYCFN